VEISSLTYENGKCKYTIVPDSELESLLSAHQAEVERKKAEELAKEKKLQQPTK
jgi:hypothetical protein